MQSQREVLEGYLVDIACLRKYPQQEIPQRAQEHTRACALHGHCVESGYALVNRQGHVVLLDPEATLPILSTLRENEKEHAIWLRVERRFEQGEMKTETVQSGEPPGS